MSVGTLESGSSRTVKLTVDVDADVADGTTLTNKAVVSATEDDPNPANNTALEDTDVVAEADLSITKSDSPDPVLAGNELTYTITVDSAGPSDALNVSVSDAVPAGTSFVSATGGGGGTLAAGVVTWNLGTVQESDPAVVLTLVVKVNPGRIADVSNTASVSSSTTDPAPGNNSATEDTTVQTAANLSITKSDSPDPVLAGNELTYTITVDSAGPSDALNVSVSDAVPAGTSFVSATGGGGGTLAAGVVTWNLGTVQESDQAVVLTLVVKVNPGRIADVSNTASVSSSTTDPAPGNNSATEDTTVQTAANLSITKSDSPDPVLAGNELTYTITVDSAGPSDALNVSVSDAVPAGTSFVSATGGGGGTLAAGVVTWNLGTVQESDPAVVLTLVVKVNPGRIADVSNTASVSSSTTDPAPGNNSATEDTTVQTAANLSITKSDSPDPVLAGNELTYTITVDSAGPSDALNVSVSDAVPAGPASCRPPVAVAALWLLAW